MKLRYRKNNQKQRSHWGASKGRPPLLVICGLNSGYRHAFRIKQTIRNSECRNRYTGRVNHYMARGR